MSKQEYLAQLKEYLKKLPIEEQENIIEYYSEYFDDAGAENIEKVLIELGSPQELARKVCADYAIKDLEDNNKEKNHKSKAKDVWLIILAICAAPIWIPLIIAMSAIILAIFIVIISLLFSAVVIGIAGVAAIFFSIIGICFKPSSSLMYFGSGLLYIGIGIAATIGMIYLLKALKACIIKILKKWYKRKDNKNTAKVSMYEDNTKEHNTEEQSIEKQNTEKQNTEEQNTEEHNLEEYNTEEQNTESL